MQSADVTVLVTGERSDEDLSHDLATIFNAVATRERPRGDFAEVARFVVEWGPKALGVIGGIKSAVDIVDTVLGWIKERRKKNPGFKLDIASPDGKIAVEAETRDQAIALFSGLLGQLAPKEA